MSNLMLSNRLMTAVGFARGGVFADVGTDHGYLPIYLYKKGLVKRAVASDINEMPLDSARKNIALHGAVGGIDTVLSDGLKALKGFAPDDIAIFGMGGELICRIVGDAPWTKDEKIRLILQPMTKQDEVRAFLLENGYSIVGESLSYDDGKYYQTICAEFFGTCEEYTKTELILGKHNIKRGGELFKGFLENRLEVYRTRLVGKRVAGLECEEEALVKEFEEILENIK